MLNDDIKPAGADNTDDDDIPVNSAIPQPIVEIVLLDTQNAKKWQAKCKTFDTQNAKRPFKE